jgi:UDP-N-acetylglucosamine diphosphorylase/glucosamine-1-phosphate N-acetyltransferase
MRRNVEQLAVVILAAGLGTRMKSDQAKVLHKILGRPMVLYVVDVAVKTAGENVVLVVGHQADEVRRRVSAHARVRYALQEQQLGTGHAVTCALNETPAACRTLVILCGDVPSIKTNTIERLIGDHQKHRRDVTVLAVAVEDPTGYGRIVMNAKREVVGIVEEADATEDQKRIRIINTGIYCVERDFLDRALNKLTVDNAQGEYYLTDIVAIGKREGRQVGALIAEDPQEFRGVNSQEDLAAVEALMAAQQDSGHL